MNWLNKHILSKKFQPKVQFDLGTCVVKIIEQCHYFQDLLISHPFQSNLKLFNDIKGLIFGTVHLKTFNTTDLVKLLKNEQINSIPLSK